MAGEKTQAQIDAQIDAGIRVNGNKEITPPIHNAIEKALSNSYLNKKDGGMSVEQMAGYLTEISLTDRKAFAYVGYVDDLIAAIDISWAALEGLPTDNTDLTDFLDDTYFRLDCLFPLDGNLDVNGNYILDVAGIFYNDVNILIDLNNNNWYNVGGNVMLNWSDTFKVMNYDLEIGPGLAGSEIGVVWTDTNGSGDKYRVVITDGAFEFILLP